MSKTSSTAIPFSSPHRMAASLVAASGQMDVGQKTLGFSMVLPTNTWISPENMGIPNNQQIKVMEKTLIHIFHMMSTMSNLVWRVGCLFRYSGTLSLGLRLPTLCRPMAASFSPKFRDLQRQVACRFKPMFVKELWDGKKWSWKSRNLGLWMMENDDGTWFIKPTILKSEKNTYLILWKRDHTPKFQPDTESNRCSMYQPISPIGAMDLEYHAGAHHQQFIGLVYWEPFYWMVLTAKPWFPVKSFPYTTPWNNPVIQFAFRSRVIQLSISFALNSKIPWLAHETRWNHRMPTSALGSWQNAVANLFP